MSLALQGIQAVMGVCCISVIDYHSSYPSAESEKCWDYDNNI